MTQEPPAPKTRVERHPERGHYDAVTIHGILDEGFVAHVGISTPEGPVVIPMVYGRDGDTLYLHGSARSRLLTHEGPVCVTVTLVDGLVLARSLFNHSLNYRSVVIHGVPRAVEDDVEKKRVLDVVSEHVIPGRTGDARAPTKGELDATAVVAVSLKQASAKIREGPPGKEEEDEQSPVWAGVLPLRWVPAQPVPDAHNRVGLPPYLRDYNRSRT